MKSRRSLAVAIGIFVVWAFMGTACSSGSAVNDSAPPLPEPNEERAVFVALGGDETVNRELDDPFRDAWTQRVFSTALPRSTVYVNFARPGATVSAGLSEQLPQALELGPTVATVWFGTGDDRSGTSQASFDNDLSAIVQALQSAGAHVLILTRQPSDTDSTSFDENARQVAATTGATSVVVPDGSMRSDVTQAGIAAAVAAALAS
jgi:hypothetical protein